MRFSGEFQLLHMDQSTRPPHFGTFDLSRLSID
jgi:hypothetical protein